MLRIGQAGLGWAFGNVAVYLMGLHY